MDTLIAAAMLAAAVALITGIAVNHVRAVRRHRAGGHR